MIDFDCFQCHKRLRVPNQADGRKARCPFCQAINRIQSAAPLREGCRSKPDGYEAHIDLRYEPPKSAGVAAILEVGPGIFQMFGFGHMYAGNIFVGVLFLFGYWFAATIVALIGLVTCFGWLLLPPLWLVTMILSTTTAAASCKGR